MSVQNLLTPVPEASRLLRLSPQALYRRAVKNADGKLAICIYSEIERMKQEAFDAGKREGERQFKEKLKHGRGDAAELDRILWGVARDSGNSLAQIQAGKILREQLNAEALRDDALELDIAFVPIVFDGEEYHADRSNALPVTEVV
jgi:hypothetical protein